MSLSIGKAFLRALAIAGVVTTLSAASALAAGPFADFGGSWRGAGRVSDKNGKSEALSCKSSNSPSQDGIALQLALTCASDSYRVDFHADLFTDGQALRGTWSETTRSVNGNITGTITPDLIHATPSAPGFSADVVIRVSAGKRLDVVLNAQGTSVNHVQVSMRR